MLPIVEQVFFNTKGQKAKRMLLLLLMQRQPLSLRCPNDESWKKFTELNLTIPKLPTF